MKCMTVLVQLLFESLTWVALQVSGQGMWPCLLSCFLPEPGSPVFRVHGLRCLPTPPRVSTSHSPHSPVSFPERLCGPHTGFCPVITMILSIEKINYLICGSESFYNDSVSIHLKGEEFLHFWVHTHKGVFILHIYRNLL